MMPIIITIVVFVAGGSCPGKYRCQNRRCIDQALVCDPDHHNDCGDWTDEYCMIALQEHIYSKLYNIYS